jgi:hypothetical protein
MGTFALEPKIDMHCDQKNKAKFEEKNEKMETIKKSLELYLGHKREKCPRFFFLDDEDLLYILSNVCFK